MDKLFPPEIVTMTFIVEIVLICIWEVGGITPVTRQT